MNPDRRRPWEPEHLHRLVERLAFEAFDLDFVPVSAARRAERILEELTEERDLRTRSGAD